MKKLVISLAKRTDRRKHFEEKNSSLEDWSFFDATDKDILSYELLRKNGMSTNLSWRDPYKNRKLTRGEVACAISHRNAWAYCLEIDEPLLVLEDDAIIGDSYDEQYYESLTKDYNLIYLQRNENTPDRVEPIDDMIEVPAYPYNTTAYIITPESAKILMDTTFLKQIIPADEYLPYMLPHLKPCALKNDSVKQQSRSILASDVEPNSEEEWFIDFNTHSITVGTDRKKCSAMNTSAALKGIYPTNLGNNVDWEGTDMSAQGGGHKVNLLKEYIKNLPDNDVVLFTDAYDIVYNDNLNQIVRRYMSFNTKVLFAAEQFIWPNKKLKKKFDQAQSKTEFDTKYKYLNSGMFIGVVSELKRILEHEELENESDDQLFFQNAFLSGNYDIKLDYECYIFQCHESNIWLSGNGQYVNSETGCRPCIYHGNGGEEAKEKLEEITTAVNSKSPDLFIPIYNGIDIIDRDMFIVDFMTQDQCERMIELSEKHGDWKGMEGDKFPAQEIRIKQLGLWDEMKSHWERNLYPHIEKFWKPMEMYGLRDAFTMRYALDTQTSLRLHTDASLVTGSVKLNDDYEGAVLKFPRQGITNEHVPVGKAIMFPGQVTHGHECTELTKGVKYSLTMWTSRYNGDIN